MPSLARALAQPPSLRAAPERLVNQRSKKVCEVRLVHARSLARPPAHHDEEDEVEPVPEGVRVLHEVHDVGPALETDDLK